MILGKIIQRVYNGKLFFYSFIHPSSANYKLKMTECFLRVPNFLIAISNNLFTVPNVFNLTSVQHLLGCLLLNWKALLQ